VGGLCVAGRILEWNLNRINCGMGSVGLTVVVSLLVSYMVHLLMIYVILHGALL